MAEADLSRIINIIMENPKLVEEIRNTVEKAEVNGGESAPTDDTGETAEKEAEKVSAAPRLEENTYPKGNSSRRNDLLRAMRPYVSEERGRAIESMITIADVLFSLKEK